MLLKAELLNGKAKIIGVEGNNWEEVVNTLKGNALKYECINPQLYPTYDINERYLSSKGIRNICTLTPKEELGIANKLNLNESMERQELILPAPTIITKYQW